MVRRCTYYICVCVCVQGGLGLHMCVCMYNIYIIDDGAMGAYNVTIVERMHTLCLPSMWRCTSLAQTLCSRSHTHTDTHLHTHTQTHTLCSRIHTCSPPVQPRIMRSVLGVRSSRARLAEGLKGLLSPTHPLRVGDILRLGLGQG